MDGLGAASITLMGFVSAFIIFAYKIINEYVDNRKTILRTIYIKLHGGSGTDFSAAIDNIQKIGKKECDITKITTHFVFDPGPTIESIKTLRKNRECMTLIGVVLICLWGLRTLSFVKIITLMTLDMEIYHLMSTWSFAALFILTICFVVLTLYKWLGDEV